VQLHPQTNLKLTYQPSANVQMYVTQQSTQTENKDSSTICTEI